jgi:hypothetical protein
MQARKHQRVHQLVTERLNHKIQLPARISKCLKSDPISKGPEELRLFRVLTTFQPESLNVTFQNPYLQGAKNFRLLTAFWRNLSGGIMTVKTMAKSVRWYCDRENYTGEHANRILCKYHNKFKIEREGKKEHDRAKRHSQEGGG